MWWLFSLSARILGECSTIHSQPVLYIFCYKLETRSCTLIPLFRPGSVNSGSVTLSVMENGEVRKFYRLLADIFLTDIFLASLQPYHFPQIKNKTSQRWNIVKLTAVTLATCKTATTWLVTGFPMTHGLRVFDALEPKSTPFKFVLCVKLTLYID